MGPFAYNVYTNDLIMLLSTMYDIFNYADDNTACCYGNCTAQVVQGLEKVASVMITWFKLNEMKVNGNKFQLMLSNRQMAENVSINVDGYVIKSEHVVKFWGLYIDEVLNFRAHVDNIYRKAGRKLNVLARLSGVFNV